MKLFGRADNEADEARTDAVFGPRERDAVAGPDPTASPDPVDPAAIRRIFGLDDGDPVVSTPRNIVAASRAPVEVPVAADAADTEEPRADGADNSVDLNRARVAQLEPHLRGARERLSLVEATAALRVAELEAEVDALRGDGTPGATEEQAAVRVALERRCNELEAAVISERERAEKSSASLARAETHANDLTAALADSQAQRDAAVTGTSTVRAQVDAAQRDRDEALRRVAELKDEREQLLTQVRDARETAGRIESDGTELSSSLGHARTAIDTLSHERDELTAELAKARALIQSLIGQRDSALDRRALLQEQMQKLGEAVQATRQMADRLHAKAR